LTFFIIPIITIIINNKKYLHLLLFFLPRGTHLPSSFYTLLLIFSSFIFIHFSSFF
jgi:hypothetical protein